VFDAYGHISARDPPTRARYWLIAQYWRPRWSRRGHHRVDLDNNPLAPARTGCSRARDPREITRPPDVMAVVAYPLAELTRSATATPSCVPWSATRLPREGAPVFDIRDVDDGGDLNVCTGAQARGLAQALGPHWLVLLRRHGAVCGRRKRAAMRPPRVYAEKQCAPADRGDDARPGAILTASELAYARRMKPKDPDRAWQLWKTKAMGPGPERDPEPRRSPRRR